MHNVKQVVDQLLDYEKALSTSPYDTAFQNFIKMNDKYLEELFFNTTKLSSFQSSSLYRACNEKYTIGSAEMNEFFLQVIYELPYGFSMKTCGDFPENEKGEIVGDFSNLANNMTKFSMILEDDGLIQGSIADGTAILALWRMISKKYPLIIEKKFLAECPAYGKKEFTTGNEAIEAFFDLVDEDTIEKAEWKLLYYLTNRGLLALRSDEGEQHDSGKIHRNLCVTYQDTKKKAELKRYKESLFLPNNKVLDNEKSLSAMIETIDKMEGLEFETFVGKLFRAMGYQVEVTKSSGDQGVDVIATKGDEKLGIQAKRYSKSVDNTAVQEVVAGKSMYNLTKMMVLTNNTFTASAKELAKVNDVILWDRDILLKKVEENIGKL